MRGAENKRISLVTLVTCVALLLAAWAFHVLYKPPQLREHVKVGFLYDGDESTPFTYNFMRSQHVLESKYGERLTVDARTNTSPESAPAVLEELAQGGCDIIFTTSSGYERAAKDAAAKYPQVQFCEATGALANEEPVLENYHTFMGRIYEGRYLSGVVAGMKLREMVDTGVITPEQAKVGYVAAYPYPEVISGYTAFLLGIRSVAPEAVMVVRYTNTWGSYTLEKECARKLIAEGCVLIGQHSDTTGPAVACERAEEPWPVYHVAYNQSMLDVAPTSTLICTRINWTPYIESAVEAVFQHRDIERTVKARIVGNDAGAGFDRDWVQMVELNGLIAVEGTEEVMAQTIADLSAGSIRVFQGDYIGVDPEDPSDTFDLSQGYPENENGSAPTFHYLLKDIITVETEGEEGG